VSPHPDAVTMNSWVFLKESMTQIREEVQNLLTVKDDVSSLQMDLKVQEALWITAEKDLKNENLQLAAQVESLRQQANAGQSTRTEVEKLQRDLAKAQHHNAELQLEAEHEKKRVDLEHAFYTQRRDNLTSLVQGINTGVQTEVMRAHDRQLQLETDGVALQLKTKELQQRLKTGLQNMRQQKLTATAEVGDVQRQLAGMHDGLRRLQAALSNAGSIEAQKAETAKVQGELEHEVRLMVSVQQEQANTIADCKRMHTAREDALCAEKRKAEHRKKEAKELCDPVRGQMVALRQMLDECMFNGTRPPC
jgi:hypothetical protein